MLKVQLHMQVLSEQVLHNGLHVASDTMAIALDQLNNALGCHEETVPLHSFLQGGCVAVNNTSNL